MDSLTHIAIGACVGEAFFEKGFGKKAMIWGAVAQSIPDIDFVSSLWLNTSESLLAHRGFTHSLLFAILIVPFFALIANSVHRPHNISFYKWVAFFLTEVFIHLFIDAFNNYGIGWFEPFSHHRFSFNIIYVADPFFSIPSIFSLVMLIFLGKYDVRRKKWWKIGVYIPVLYLSYCSINKLKIDNIVKQNLDLQHLSNQKYFTTPAPLQNWLWYVVVNDSDGFYVGFYSLFDKKNSIKFHYFPQNKYLLKDVSDHEELQKLIRFSKNYYTIEKWHDTLVFNDLRFGQILGWHFARNHFVFHYYLEHSEESRLVVQRGRFMGWNKNEFNIFIHRVFNY
jgi:inner membrane protein